MKKKTETRGRKPKYKGAKCERRSVSMPDDLWAWCEKRALVRGMSVSAYIVQVLAKRKLTFEAKAGVTK